MNKNRLQIFFGLLLISAIVIWAGYFANSSADVSGQAQVYFLNVGQGDSEYIKTKSGQDILIDGGPDSKVLNELGKVMDFNDRKIDLVVLTHPHADHLTGLIEVIRRYEIGQVWESGVAYPSSTYDAWKAEIKSKNIPDLDVQAGESKNFGSENFSVLYPLLSEKNKTIDNLNNSSVVTILNADKISFLFLGDLENQTQKEFINNLGQITVLKVAHHGSTNGTAEDLLKAIRPSVAVIEVGKNNYGHPPASIISLLKSYAVQIYRTDQNDTVEISTDGQTYQVNAH